MELRTPVNVRRTERHTLRLFAVGGLAAIMAVSCRGTGGARVVLPVAFEDATPSAAPRYPEDFASHEAVVRGVAVLLARELALPVPEQVTVYIYSSRAGFEQGLVNDGRLPVVRASELSGFAVGVGKRRQLLLHADGAPSATRDWLRLVAHELTHVAQIELAQGEGRAEQWLAEGMAEWAAFTVLERLGLDFLADRRAAAIGHVRDHPALRSRRLDLATLGTSRGFTVRHLQEGSLPTYQLAFLMTDYVVRRFGFESLLAYFRGFAAGRGRHESFQLAFGRTLAEFEAEILDHLREVAR
ncbi:MAG TPA: hypothetical protein VGD07_20940 [Methylomirabilota bacterium]